MRRYLDCNLCLGPPALHDAMQIYQTDDVVTELHYAGIRSALAWPLWAREHHPGTGNRWILKSCQEHRALLPCWVVGPHYSGDWPKPDELVDQMQAAHVQAARICPLSQRWPLIEEACGQLLDALARTNIPVFIDSAESPIEGMASLCKRHPHLPVVITGAGWNDYRCLAPLIATYSNLHIEFSRMQLQYGLEQLCTAGYERQLLFGTGLPDMAPGAAIAYVEYSEISERQRDLIAHGNLERLIGKVESPPAPPRKVDPYIAAVESGAPIPGADAIDSHAHILADGETGGGTSSMYQGDAAGMIRRMDRLGIQTTCVSAWEAILGNIEGNHAAESAVKRYPDRFVGYAALNPNYPNFDAQMARWHQDPGMLGVKPYHPVNRYPIDGPIHDQWWAYANRYRRFALIHMNANDKSLLLAVEKLAVRYPHITFIAAHAAGIISLARDVAAMAAPLSNVVAEITLTPVPLNTIEFLVEQLGAERVVFGTDTPMRDPIPHVGWAAYTKLPVEAKRLLFRDNMKRILERVIVE